MTNSMIVVLICAFMTGVLGIATLLTFFFLGVNSVWFQALAVVQGSFATAMVCALVISMTYIYVVVNYP